MRMSITQVGTNLINEIIEYLTQGGGSLPFVELERGLTTKVQACVCNIMSRYIEEINHQIVSDKVDRRRAGFSVERHDDKRQKRQEPLQTEDKVPEIVEISGTLWYNSHR